MADTSTYQYNVLLVRALLNFTPTSEQGFARRWLELLDDMTKTSNELSQRADYVWYLLRCLESGHLATPFNEPPPSRSNVKPLYEILPSAVYEEVVKRAAPTLSWVDELVCVSGVERGALQCEGPPEGCAADCQEICGVERGVSSSRFFPTQPVPRYGTLCYGCVFGPQTEM